MLSIKGLISEACKVAFGHDGHHDNETNEPGKTYTGAHVQAGLMHMAKIYKDTPDIQTAHHNAYKELDIQNNLDYDSIKDLVNQVLDYMDANDIQLPASDISNSYRAELTTDHIIAAIETNSEDQILMDCLRFGNLINEDTKPTHEPPKLVIDNTNIPENG